jgi:SAM-dependent methyltransferase
MVKRRRSAPPAGELGGQLGNGNGKDERPAIAIEFPHGLGDLVQLSIVLHHVAAATPSHQLVAICDTGKTRSKTPWETKRLGFNSPEYRREDFAQVISLPFLDCHEDVAGLPSTKTLRCLRETFRLEPRAEWWQYTCEVSELARIRAARYLSEVSGIDEPHDGRFPVAMIHYQGYSSRMQKDIPVEIVREVVTDLQARGFAVVLLDIDGPSKLAADVGAHVPMRGHPVWALPGQADPETMLAMIDASSLMIGIDSGPLHLAGCSSTPTIGVWTHHHPIRYYDFAPNVTHLVPAGHARLANGDRSLRTFKERYRHSVYSRMTTAIAETVEQVVTLPVRAGEPRSVVIPGLHATTYGEQYYREHVMGGLDYLGHGDWQEKYGVWLACALGWRSHRVLDVGCACGSILRGLGKAGIVVQGVDLSDYMVSLGREKWPDMAPLMHVADAADLRIFPDASWDDLHSAQVAEHWHPDSVPQILAELARITRDGGLFFCCLDTEELFARQGRAGDGGDPTHICIRPLEWWYNQLDAAGWENVTEEYRPRLSVGCDSFLRRYDWDFFVARRRPREG